MNCKQLQSVSGQVDVGKLGGIGVSVRIEKAGMAAGLPSTGAM